MKEDRFLAQIMVLFLEFVLLLVIVCQFRSWVCCCGGLRSCCSSLLQLSPVTVVVMYVSARTLVCSTIEGCGSVGLTIHRLALGLINFDLVENDLNSGPGDANSDPQKEANGW